MAQKSDKTKKGDLKKQFFLAVIPPDSIRQDIAYSLRREDYPLTENWDWKNPDDYHITIAYPGALTETEASDLKTILFSLDMKAFTMQFDGLGHFLRNQNKQKNNRHILWVRPDNSSDNAIREIHYKVVTALQNAGFRYGYENFRVTPHMTLAKPPIDEDDQGAMSKFMRDFNHVRSQPFKVTQLGLYETLSQSNPNHPNNNGGKGSKYKLVQAFDLK